MLGIKYFKTEPTEFARVIVNGVVKKEGKGISSLYIPFRTSIELVLTTAQDQGFIFKEISADSQEVSLQGGFVYRIESPDLVLKKYNLSIDPATKEYLTDDNTKLPQHLLQLVQAEARKIVQKTSLEELLVMSEGLSSKIADVLKKSEVVSNLGVNFEVLYFSSIVPKPEISKALEAGYRESLLQKADEAIYSRRALAVEKERAIQENELKTKIGIEEKRKQLVELEGANILKQAEVKAEASKKEFKVFEGIEPAELTARALYELGKNASKIENLTITPEILSGVLNRIKRG